VNDEKRNCDTHGLTLFKFKQNKKGTWYVCHECLKEQWRKAKKKHYIKNPAYTKSWQKDTREIRKYFSIYLRLILHISTQTPE
jgi:hypothetical protein